MRYHYGLLYGKAIKDKNDTVLGEDQKIYFSNNRRKLVCYVMYFF